MNTLPASVLVLGSGALKIGQAGEFDYSGAQALKVLRQAGIRSILVNPNIATVQTSEGMADRTFFLPVEPSTVLPILEQERPEGILLSFGGQTALNCGLALARGGHLERLGIRVLGTPVPTIVATEDRQAFASLMRREQLPVARSGAAATVPEAEKLARELGFPLILRTAFSLGGEGSRICHTPHQVRHAAHLALKRSGQVLLEEYLGGWKEVEYEVLRDAAGNSITVCNMENMDPMGIHTGESVVVAPSQTLSDQEYHHLRDLSLRIADVLGVIGECNVQYALQPGTGEVRIIEVNPRLSRSSALASKATGYPLATVAAHLALGHLLPDLRNQVTRHTSAFFEPALDYLVCKIPRWDMEKFRGVSRELGSAMKSVGEVMAVGASFEEALQKGLRMIGNGRSGLVGITSPTFPSRDLPRLLRQATDQRLDAIVQALREGWSVAKLARTTRIDPWFLQRMERLVHLHQSLGEVPDLDALDAERLHELKRSGFSDTQIAQAMHLRSTDGSDPQFQVRARRLSHKIRPVPRQIDTVAAEHPAPSNYLYLTYGGHGEGDWTPLPRPCLVLGSGPYRVGSSVEFDWCGVMALRALRAEGHASLMINCNPETASTDFDESDRLYFEELSVERVLDILDLEKPQGVIPSMGGQTANNLIPPLAIQGIPFLGTAPDAVDTCEDRRRFSALLDELGLHQPPWTEVTSLEEAEGFATHTGFPLLVRPSYVLSGQAMQVVRRAGDLPQALEEARVASQNHPVVLSSFVEGAKEIELDAVAVQGKLVFYGISEHLEHAGVHSGDATMVFPPQRVYSETLRRIRSAARILAEKLTITGPFNIQFLARGNAIQIIECNCRASRSFPLIAKALKRDPIALAIRGMLGQPVARVGSRWFDLDHVVVKAAQFSFSRLSGVDPVLGVDMASTGEAAAFGKNLDEALTWAMAAVGYPRPTRGILLSGARGTVNLSLLACARLGHKMGLPLFATPETARTLRMDGLPVIRVSRRPGRGTTARDILDEGLVDLVLAFSSQSGDRDTPLRRLSLDTNTPLLTNARLGLAFLRGLSATPPGFKGPVRAWQDYTVPRQDPLPGSHTPS